MFRKFHLKRCLRPLQSIPTRGCRGYHKKTITIEENFPLALGDSLSKVDITYEQWGDSKLPGERTVVIFPSFSHSSHAASNRDDPSPGWWEGIIGPGKAINTSIFRVICASVLGAPYGTTSPLSINPATGQKFGADFPQILMSDMAACHRLLLQHLGLDHVHAVIGGSMGGMQVLEYAAKYPDAMDRIISLSATAKTTPGTVAFRRVQRQAILADPKYNSGNYDKDNYPVDGMKIARELGMACYRSREEFDSRFDWQPTGPMDYKSITFDVESYMEYKARKFARMYDPNCYLLLSKAMDLTDLGRDMSSLADGVRRITCKSLVCGVEQDLLVPLHEQKFVSDTLSTAGRESEFIGINSKFGHDAMFHPAMQANTFRPIVKEYLERGFEAVMKHEQLRYSSL